MLSSNGSSRINNTKTIVKKMLEAISDIGQSIFKSRQASKIYLTLKTKVYYKYY